MPASAPKAASATLYAAKDRAGPDAKLRRLPRPEKVKGGLRLDSYAGITRGGEDGPIVAPWHPEKSELLRRVTLPPDDDDFMPSGGKKALTAGEIALLRVWIAAGASDKEPADVVTK